MPDERDRRMNGQTDPLWEALGDLGESRVVLDARRYASVRAKRRQLFRSLKESIWPRVAVAGLVACLLLLVAFPREEVVRTGVGEIRRTTLADGSVVTLDAGSRLRVRIGPHAREVALLSGQARFDVAHDAARPFRVSANGMTVTALGTAFDVVALPRGTAVTLIRGKVLVEAAAKVLPSRAVLQPGQQVSLANDGLTQPRPARLDAVLAWQRQLIDLSSMSLTDAVYEVNRYSDVKLVIRDPALANERVSGVFRAGDVDAVAAALATYFDLAVVRRDTAEIVLDRSTAAHDRGA